MKKYILLICLIGIAFQKISAQSQLRFSSEEEFRLGKTDNVSSYLKHKLSLSDNHDFIDEGIVIRDSVIRTNSVYTDSLGMTHIRLNQYYKGVPIENSMIKVHMRDGKIIYSNGEYVRCEGVDMTCNYTPQMAITIALKSINTRLKHDDGDTTLVVLEKPKVMLCHSKKNRSDTALHLCYKVVVLSTAEALNEVVYIDAKSGEMLGSVSNYINHNGRAETRYSGVQTIKTSYWDWFGIWYKLEQCDDDKCIRTANLNSYYDHRNSLYWTHFKDGDNNWDSEYNNEEKDNGALDAFWGLGKTYDYFKTVHSWRSFDGNDFPICSFVHWGDNEEQACFDRSYGVLLFGDGGERDILTSLDIVAHEFGHGISYCMANLDRVGEPAALDEGLSDIWGACVENWAITGKNTWEIGEDVGTPVRIMSNPMTYRGTNWNDSADEHYNAGVLNYWFYLLAHGGSGTNDHGLHYNVTGIGMIKAAKIVFRAEANYMTSSTDYQAFCNYTIRAARELYSGQEIASTLEAWRAVGLLHDYYTRDNYRDDGTEPLHYVSDGYQDSPDVWLRRNADDGTTHQKARHNSINYVYVNVHNRGLTNFYVNWPNWGLLPDWIHRKDSMEVYVKKASLGIDTWPHGWERIGCVALPAIASGDNQIVRIEGHFPSVESNHPHNNPYNIALGNNVDYAILTRIVSRKDIMAYPEMNNTLLNVINNNNISYKNVVVSSALFLDDIFEQIAALDIDNIDRPRYRTNMRFTSPQNDGGSQLIREAEIRIVFDRHLLELWRATGAEFVGMRPIDDTTFLVSSPDAAINGATIPENYYGYMRMQTNFLTHEYTDKYSYEYNISEYDPQGGRILGSATIVVYKNPRDVLFDAKAGNDLRVKKNTQALLSAENINEDAVYNWYNANGEFIGRGDTLSVNVTATSKYKLEVIAKADGYKDYDSIFVVATYGTIEDIAPNPANTQTIVTYDLCEEITSATIVIANVSGQVLYTAPIDVTQTSHTINLQSIPVGQYVVRIESQGTLLDSKTLIVK